jgi:metal-responsive CopG/Arc/MetJ family transcriptional regulator
MSRAKIAITIDEKTLDRLDQLVDKAVYPNRSKAIEAALQEKLARLDRSRLARECAKLNPRAEKLLAEEGMAEDSKTWPEY